jgi:hypothetical protein
MKYRLKQKVRIIKQRKTDGRYNFGTIVGTDLEQNGFYLGYLNFEEFLRRFTIEKYKVVYIDCATKRACTEWFYVNEIDCGKEKL